MFVPDLLHEFELGVWKATFSHLLRILYAAAGDTIQTLNTRWVIYNYVLRFLIMINRFRLVPTFGGSTI